MSRYGISEWYGRSIFDLAPTERQRFARSALGQAPPRACPFVGKSCHKAGGVCAIQRYEPRGGVTGAPVIVCPTRFEQENILLYWLAEIVGFEISTVQVAREVAFMESTATRRSAGRIDIVLARVNDGLRWFGLEVQAVYFSGKGMQSEFEALAASTDIVPPYPSAVRRPDWRSSSAKRLMPQLQIKAPTLMRWGSKIAVAVDRPFFQQIGGPSPDPSRDLNDGDVIWMVPALTDGVLKCGHWEVLTLEESSNRLLSARTINRQTFEAELKAKLRPIC